MPKNESSQTEGDAQTPDEPSADAAGRSEVSEIIDELDEMRNRMTETEDRLLRTRAELDNFRKRARRELDEERRYAEINVLRDLLPLVDNINRAIDAAQRQADAGKLLEGLKMMAQQFDGIFQRHHCKVILPAIGEPFDPSRHEAVMQQPSDEYPEHTIVGIAQFGLELHDRVVRPAQVIVSTRTQPHAE